jgi:two-component system sensor histidine kinase PilS (NtrC family)
VLLPVICSSRERQDALRLQQSETRFTIRRGDVLRWIYVGRLVLVSGILVAALLAWGSAEPGQTFLATVLFLASFTLTGLSFWYTELSDRTPGDGFVFLQVVFDALLVTGIVHITGGAESNFAFLYVLVISSGALLLPLPGGVLVGVLATLLYLGITVGVNPGNLQLEVFLQMGLFATVALVTGFLGDRVRRAGLAVGRMESALRQLRLDTGDILANIGTGVMTVDAAGHLMYLNPAGESLLDLGFEEWRGKEVVEAVERVAPGMGSALKTSLARGEPMARLKSIARREEGELVLGISTTVLERDAGTPPSVTAIFQDITGQERLNVLNRRTERLEAVAELSASLAHEIKNPLASIRSAVEQLSGSGLNGEDRVVLSRLVVSESERLSRLLSGFIEFSVLRMGNSGQVDLATISRDCVTLVSKHPEMGIGVRILERGLDREVLVPGDADLLHRAIFNLVLNAVQFAGPAGIVRVELENQEECADAVGPRVKTPVCLIVTDSGPGVPRDEVDRIFDPFFSSRVGGSGLGLAVVHRAVEAHQGAVIVEESPEGGAQFKIFLPGKPEAEEVEAK